MHPTRILSLVNKLPLEKVESFVALFKKVKTAVFYGRCPDPHNIEQNRLKAEFDLHIEIAEHNLKVCRFYPDEVREAVLCNIEGMFKAYNRLFEIASKYNASREKWYGELIAAL